MKHFEFLQDLLDYVPNCIICGKTLPINLNVSLFIENAPCPASYFYKTENVGLKLELKDGILQSCRHKRFNLSINPKNNLILDGLDMFKNINWIYVNKKCWTCNFEIETKVGANNTVPGHFPSSFIKKESIQFFMSKDKDFYFEKRYVNNKGEPDVQPYFTLNGYIKKFHNYELGANIDFSKITNKKQIANKLEMLLTFS